MVVMPSTPAAELGIIYCSCSGIIIVIIFHGKVMK
jgi:hypothetical protein